MITCAPERAAIAAALNRLFSPGFRASLSEVTSPYGEGGASEKVVQVIRTFPLGGTTKKAFYDQPLFETERE